MTQRCPSRALEVTEGGGTRRGELHGHWGRRGALGLEWGENALEEVAGDAGESGKYDATGSGSVAVPGTGDREDRFERAGYNIRSVRAKQVVENHTLQVDATRLGWAICLKRAKKAVEFDIRSVECTPVGRSAEGRSIRG
ncbi:hypothetical protein Q9L58_001870 [Maublancomyces gigas]|uniref:Uncharacterized protein n=1 Tax=Discina gigas TaxID=1032678 RepID=A0ABR3GSS2_9PEZI